MTNNQIEYPEDDLWEKAKKLDPKDAMKRCDVKYENDHYIIPSLNEEYHVYPLKEEVKDLDGNIIEGFDKKLVLLTYLNQVKSGEISGEWVAGKSLKLGMTFFKGGHSLPTKKLEEKFGKDEEKFKTASKALKGVEVSDGDAAYVFHILPKVPMKIVMWFKDEEFSASASILFDKSIDEFFALDVVLTAATLLVEKILNQ